MEKRAFIVFFIQLSTFYLVAFCYQQHENTLAPESNVRDVSENEFHCGEPGRPASGSVYYKKNSKNKLSYSNCIVGFVLLGESERKCEADGSWYPPIPKCVQNLASNKIAKHESNAHLKFSTDSDRRTCGTQTSNFHGIVDFEQQLSFNTIQLIFNNTRIDHPNKIRIYIASNIEFEQGTIKNKDSLLEIYNNTFTVAISKQQIGFDVPKLARYLIIWFQNSTLICEIIVFNSNEATTCGKPDQPLHGRMLRTTSYITTLYKCDPGYTMSGNEIVNCKNGVFEHAIPKCLSEKSFAEKNDGEKPSKTNIILGVGVGLAALCLILIAAFYIYRKFKCCCFKKRPLETRETLIEGSVMHHNSVTNDENHLYEVVEINRECSGNRSVSNNATPQLNEIISVENEVYESF